jgi:hypothetical protein
MSWISSGEILICNFQQSFDIHHRIGRSIRLQGPPGKSEIGPW